ncbi:MAG: S-adenosylmethionine:tRNA ribosyltransferase-isomerase, partial [Brevinema sp.]
DEERYQTLFAKYYGSIAAPTASLRFSSSIMEQLQNKGVIFKEITLHVGLGTFKPIDTDPDEYKIHQEFVSVDHQTINEINQAKQRGQRIIAAGTTVCRALESAGTSAFEGWTDIFIKPGYQFQVIDGLFTNFHLPHSSLLLLVQAFIGIEETQTIYQQALEQHYRFFSYGDGMFLLKNKK